MKFSSVSIFAAAGLLLSATAVLASPGHSHSHSHSTESFGRPGDSQAVDRTIEVRMGDNFFEPKSLEIKAGETVRFVLHNEGVLLHEFNLGDAAYHAAHQQEMAAMFANGTLSATGAHGMSHSAHAMGDMKMEGMEHDDPNSVLLEPDMDGELIWTFSATTDLEFACNVPGHYQAGMVGTLSVR